MIGRIFLVLEVILTDHQIVLGQALDYCGKAEYLI